MQLLELRRKTKEPCLVVVVVDRSLSKEITKEIRSHLSRVFPKHNIKRIFVESKLPVDARHNAKIHRLSLARKWSDKVSKPKSRFRLMKIFVTGGYFSAVITKKLINDGHDKH